MRNSELFNIYVIFYGDLSQHDFSQNIWRAKCKQNMMVQPKAIRKSAKFQPNVCDPNCNLSSGFIFMHIWVDRRQRLKGTSDCKIVVLSVIWIWAYLEKLSVGTEE